MKNATNAVPVWGSSGMVWAALFLGSTVSAADAVAMGIDVPLSLFRVIQFVSLPGGVCAQLANWILRGGHSVTSPMKEFALSLPFNSLAYWMVVRAAAGLVWILFPSKAPR
jgi:hypothetical protein